jgi:hypothetical protein
VLGAAVGMDQHREDAVVQEEAHSGAQRHGQDGDHQSSAQLGQVLDEAHLATGSRWGLAPAEGEPGEHGRVP